ncbi:anti-sigma factor [Paenibacillus sp. GD4]|uniref:anti-sigma factor n=1 Tax=Paenibacillus sp. GD4 TaxID=3068890 RepID=UPI002796AA2C|nr:anti-sigma factor [Paenibacillus sp. GD4]MDQ1914560.1 anti-sigma factor [Paenibacillus sp. GD4]
MHTHHGNPCDALIPFLTGDCNEAEKAEYERHLLSCPHCRQEIKELQNVWMALPFTAEEVEVPSDLKAEVMDHIFTDKQENGTNSEFHKNRQNKHIRWYTSAAAAFFIAIAGMLWWQSTDSRIPGRQAEPQEANRPAEIIKTVALKAVDPAMPNATGNAWVLKQGDMHKVVVEMNGLTKTTGDEAYQVWLVYEGKRYNCGTLYVNNQGSGMLSYDIKRSSLTFDAIGVTLEPDSNGTQPRGKKVLGS